MKRGVAGGAGPPLAAMRAGSALESRALGFARPYLPDRVLNGMRRVAVVNLPGRS